MLKRIEIFFNSTYLGDMTFSQLKRIKREKNLENVWIAVGKELEEINNRKKLIYFQHRPQKLNNSEKLHKF